MSLTDKQREILRVLAELPNGTAALPGYVWFNVHLPLEHDEIVEVFDSLVALRLAFRSGIYWSLTSEGRDRGKES